MKKFAVFLALSLAANAALLVTFLVHRVTTGTGDGAVPITAVTPGGGPTRLTSGELAVLGSSDRAQLQAAGVPDDLARDLLVGRAYNRWQARLAAARGTGSAKVPYWRNPFSRLAAGSPTKEQRAALRQAQHDYNLELRDALGDAAPGRNDPRDNFLPAAKMDQLRRIADDYNDLKNEVYSDMNGFQLPSDRDKLRLLREEQERDIAAVLSPEEQAQYQFRYSNAANEVRGQLGDGIQSEDEFKKIVALQKAFDDQYSPPEAFVGGPPSRDFLLARNAAQNQLTDDIRAAVGDENFAAIRRATDSDYQALNALVNRLGLPPETADTLYASRDTYAAQSLQINADPALSSADRVAQLQALAGKAIADLQSTLGAEGATAYSQRANWINLLKSGSAFSTNPKDAPNLTPVSFGNSVYPVARPHPAPPLKG